MNSKLTLDIWSDMLCPFCFIGKRNLDKALAQFSHAADIDIRWHSYQLAPNLEYNPDKDAHQALADHKGMSYETAKQLNEQVVQMAVHSGITFDIDNMKWANSFLAHRLLQWAKTEGKAHELEERLFEAVFVKGENISDTKQLINIAKEIGLSETEVEKALTGDFFTKEVQEDISNAQYVGLRGVPHFVINDQATFSGALSPDSFLQILVQYHENWKKNQDISVGLAGESCDIEGNCE
ncbi:MULTISPECIES: DsbA family oxidoreductase [Flavobacterium]|uniref:DsbA family oxidoreductase n=1 Tax=Flavobacterium hankyongi TaxID=1176532 RepID=A0ABP8ZJ99_9FLAO|nr:DsbA family oxidoreductase [Flavobacterium sp. N1846]